jgi:hypothetical protein
MAKLHTCGSSAEVTIWSVGGRRIGGTALKREKVYLSFCVVARFPCVIR